MPRWHGRSQRRRRHSTLPSRCRRGLIYSRHLTREHWAEARPLPRELGVVWVLHVDAPAAPAGLAWSKEGVRRNWPTGTPLRRRLAVATETGGCGRGSSVTPGYSSLLLFYFRLLKQFANADTCPQILEMEPGYDTSDENCQAHRTGVWSATKWRTQRRGESL